MSFNERGLVGIRYQYDAYPVSLLTLQLDTHPPETINCQKLVQVFFRDMYGMYLCPQNTMSQESYYAPAVEVLDDSHLFPNDLRFGDIIYADNLKLTKPPSHLNRYQRLHMGIYIATPTECGHLFPQTVQAFAPDEPLILHAAPKLGSTIQSWQDFVESYSPIRARRIV